MSTISDFRDYSLTGKTAREAVDNGLAEAVWYQSPVPREQIRALLERRDGPAIRDIIIWLGLLVVSGVAGYMLWGSWWAVIPFFIYGVLWGSAADSRWHECGHGTAFKTDWMNNTVYEIASFMLMRESTIFRWTHVRHHSDTIVVGRDPEIVAKRPPSIMGMILDFFALRSAPEYFSNLFLHARGKLTDEQKVYVPEEEEGKIFFKARLYLAIYALVIAFCFYQQTWLPLMFVGLPTFYGGWLKMFWAVTQHVGLAENVLDHRLNCRTIKVDPINAFLYWNMHYHVEHHMFPLVPYHALPKLHELIKADTPRVYESFWEAYKEIIPALKRQLKDPDYFIQRELPERKELNESNGIIASDATVEKDSEGWVKVCHKEDVKRDDIIRFDLDASTFALYRTVGDDYYATDGMCTHGQKHLTEGLIIGDQIECPKHNGRFNLKDGSPKRAPVCIKLQTYALKIVDNFLWVDLSNKTDSDSNELAANEYRYKVVSNRNVATFIKELVLEPADAERVLAYQPGDYVQFKIPTYKHISFADFTIDEPYKSVWVDQGLMNCSASNPSLASRSYSMATTPETDQKLSFTIRIATPPKGQESHAGLGTSYVFSLNEGDEVVVLEPTGDFRIKDTEKEMVYVGGGAGMAPLKSHITHLFRTLKTGRKVSYWYGARSLQEAFYVEEFEQLAQAFDNFSFHLALSEPQPEDNWSGATGFIHEVVKQSYLDDHSNPAAVEYYLCGPPQMVQASRDMLIKDYSVDASEILFDEF